MSRVAFVSFRLKGQDGVSVEAEKWIRVFRGWGDEVFRVAGDIPDPGAGDTVVPGLNYRDPPIESFTARAFDPAADWRALKSELAGLRREVEQGLLPVLKTMAPDIVVAENLFSLPVNIPLTLVLGDFLVKEKISLIAVHHDFYWEHERFSRSGLNGLLARQFPAPLHRAKHVTINSQAREELFRRTGISATCVHNCFDFDSPRRQDDFNEGLRRDLGVGEAEIFFLQPTRAIERKGICKAIKFVDEFVSASGRPAKLVVTGQAEDGFGRRFEELRRSSAAGVIHVPGWFGYRRQAKSAGSPYDVRDAYAHCDLVTFPSTWEGFGNPVLESVVHRKPVLVAGYPVLDELRAYGFQFIDLDDRVVERVKELMERPSLLAEMVDANFEIGRQHFSLDKLRQDISDLVSSMPA